MKNAKTTFLVAGFISIAVGIFCLIVPLFAPQILPYFAGSIMVLLAAFLLMGVLRFQKVTIPLSWIISEIVTYALLGIALIFSKFIPIETYNVLILWTVLFSIELLRYAFFLRDIRFSMWWAGLGLAIFGFLIAVFSLFLVSYAEILFSYLLAFYFIMAGIASISLAYNSTLNLIEKAVRIISRFITRVKKKYKENREFRKSHPKKTD